MVKNKKPLSNEYLLPILGIVFGAVLFLMDTLGVVTLLRSGVSFVMTPIAFSASEAGSSFKEYFQTFVKLGDFREEYNELSISVYEKEVENAFYSLLEEENDSLRKQINLGNTEHRYVMAKVLSDVEYNSLRINEGEDSGIAIGDTVVLGNMFVGLVINVDKEGALIRLPTSKGNNLEVVVMEGGVENARLSESTGFLTKGVVEAVNDGLKIENMSMSADLHDGDIVVVNDSRVGEYLVLGYLVGLSDNPATTSRSGYVSPIVEYDELITVFVKISS